jgi:hypothetical protein
MSALRPSVHAAFGGVSASWEALDRELAAHGATGRRPAFWWRDDDAVAPGLALERLLAIGRRHGLPIALAVIPARVLPALADIVEAEPRVTVIQHGWDHRSHAPPGAKRAELGDHRPPAAMLDDLRRGRERLEGLFHDRYRPVLAPPWNRLGPDLAGRLADAGYEAVSGFGPPPTGTALPWINTHVDLVDWYGSRGFVGTEAALASLVGALRERRARVDGPVGILTHHLVHDTGLWVFLDALAARLGRHPAVDWPLPDGLFARAA